MLLPVMSLSQGWHVAILWFACDTHVGKCGDEGWQHVAMFVALSDDSVGRLGSLSMERLGQGKVKMILSVDSAALESWGQVKLRA